MSSSLNIPIHLDACAQADLVRRKDVTPAELLEEALARIEKLNPLLNAVVSLDPDFASDRADKISVEGAFAGVPTLIKDVLPYPGHLLRMGGNFLPAIKIPTGSPYTNALDASGLVVLGKSATSEFALLGTTEALCRPPVRNPWNLDLSSGGSSGGAVAAVASGMVPVAHASDGGGSIRGPSSFCGLFGFKPSRGRTASTGLPEGSPLAGLMSEHCVSRSVRDSLTWLRSTEASTWQQKLSSKQELRREKLKVGFYTESSSELPAARDAARSVETAAKACEALGHTVFEMRPPAVDTVAAGRAFFGLRGAMVAGGVDHFRSAFGPAFAEDRLEPYTRAVAEHGRSLPPGSLVGFVQTLSQTANYANAAMADLDVMLCPSVPFPAFELGLFTGDKEPEELDAFTVSVARYTFLASIAGWPAMSVPLLWTEEGLPLGSHFAAAQGRDDVLFSLALELEEAFPWQPRLTGLMEKLDAATP